MKKFNRFVVTNAIYVVLTIVLLVGTFLMTSGCAPDNNYYNSPTYNCNLTYDQDIENSVIVVKHGKQHKIVTVSGTCLMPNGTNTVTIQ